MSKKYYVFFLIYDYTLIFVMYIINILNMLKFLVYTKKNKMSKVQPIFSVSYYDDYSNKNILSTNIKEVKDKEYGYCQYSGYGFLVDQTDCEFCKKVHKFKKIKID